MKNIIIIGLVVALIICGVKLGRLQDRLKRADVVLISIDHLCDIEIASSKDSMYISGVMASQKYIRRARKLYTQGE